MGLDTGFANDKTDVGLVNVLVADSKGDQTTFKNKCGLQSHYGTFILQLEDGGAESKACKQAAANIFEANVTPASDSDKNNDMHITYAPTQPSAKNVKAKRKQPVVTSQNIDAIAHTPNKLRRLHKA
ncbi:MAG: hypothetical protein FRX49_02797 [Trebouxia sp. A1-2]|nr:MAG: hypothetical protein FRX49_02797 [Trebouxia sp. A1-2]